MRILNRPATAAEVETCRKDMQAVDDDHRRMAEELGQRETEFALNRPALERKRQAAIATAQAALAAYEKSSAPKLAEQERKKAEATAKLEADLKTYETTGLAKKMADWEKENASSIVNRWPVLEPKTMSATNRSVLTKEPDGSIVVSGPNKNGVVTIVGRDRADRDHRPPARGPDRQPAAQQGPRPGDRRQLRAQRARADRGPQGRPETGQAGQARRTPWPTSARTSFAVAKAIDGSANDPGNGWAVSPATGVDPLGDVRDQRSRSAAPAGRC